MGEENTNPPAEIKTETEVKAAPAVEEKAEAEVRYAGFWIRLVAFIVDAILVQIVGTLAMRGAGLQQPLDGSLMPTRYYVLSLAIDLVYYTGFWAWRGQTPGKMLLGLKIVKANGSNLGIGDSIIRYVGYLVSWITIGIGYLWIAFDHHKQGFHDKMASTYVIRIKR